MIGLADATVPVEDGAGHALAARHQRGYTTIRFVPDLGHGLRQSSGSPSTLVAAVVASWVQSPELQRAGGVRGGPARQRNRQVSLSEPPAGLTPVLYLSGALTLVGFALNRVGRRRLPRSRRAAVRRLDGLAAVALFTWLGNHVGLLGLAVTGALGAGAVPMAACWVLVKVSSAAVVVAIRGRVRQWRACIRRR